MLVSDWSPDVCSSDLVAGGKRGGAQTGAPPPLRIEGLPIIAAALDLPRAQGLGAFPRLISGATIRALSLETRAARSEERRVGKEGGAAWGGGRCYKDE